MPRLIIKLSNQQDQIFELANNETLIGRGEDSDLILPNISVSREHAKIEVDGETNQVKIIDVKSENGLTVNNKKVQEKILETKDEILIGNFTLVYLSDEQEDKFYRGRAVIYLPKYNHKRANPTQDKTFKLSAKDVKNIIKEKGTLHHGCVVDETMRKFFPESHPLSFGGQTAMIRAKGWFTSGVAAIITWDGRRHILEKKKWLCSVKVNGRSVKKHALRENDKITVGSTEFQYQMDK